MESKYQTDRLKQSAEQFAKALQREYGAMMTASEILKRFAHIGYTPKQLNRKRILEIAVRKRR